MRMSQTGWQERREFEERLSAGRGLTAHETQRLIDDADAGERAEAVLEALEKALHSQLGVTTINSTTDDDGGEIRIDLVRETELEDLMGSFHVPSVSHAVAPAKGAAVATPIPVPSLHAGDTLLAVIVAAPVGDVAGLDPGAFVVAEGEIESATVDTDGKNLIVLHTS